MRYFVQLSGDKTTVTGTLVTSDDMSPPDHSIQFEVTEKEYPFFVEKVSPVVSVDSETQAEVCDFSNKNGIYYILYDDKKDGEIVKVISDESKFDWPTFIQWPSLVNPDKQKVDLKTLQVVNK